MNRRYFITSAVGAAVAVFIATSSIAAGANFIDYEPGLIENKLKAGETILVDYAADWCGTCKRQERIVNELRDANPLLDQQITFIRVDWDKYGSTEVATSRNVPRRSTLLLLKGEEELGRIVAGTASDQIKALLDLGLTA